MSIVIPFLLKKTKKASNHMDSIYQSKTFTDFDDLLSCMTIFDTRKEKLGADRHN